MCDMQGPAFYHVLTDDLAAAFEQLSIVAAFFDVSDSFRCLCHNRCFLEMIDSGGRTSAVGVALSDLLAADSYAQTRAIFERARADGVPVASDDYTIRGAGHLEPRLFQGRLTPLRAADGSVQTLLASGVARAPHKLDISLFLPTGRESFDQIALLDTLISAAPIGIAFLDLDLRFVRINERLAQLNGFPVADHIGRRPRDLLPALGAAVEPVLRQVIATGRPLTNVEAAIPSSGHGGDAWMKSFYPVDDGAGRIIGVGVITADVSDERRMQQELREASQRECERAADAEAALKIRDVFFSMAAHELKTPLTTLLGQVQLIERRSARNSALDERDQRALRAVVTQATRLNKLINAMLDLTRIERGYLRLERAPLDIVSTVRRVLDEIQPTYPRHHFCWRGPETSVYVLGDAIRLEQVFYNLIENAVKYSPRGGEVRVSVDVVGAQVLICVCDQGIGISPADIPHLFDRFYRAEAASAHHIAGMGIGLYIVREIVDQHGGEVSVESVEGEGSRFLVALSVKSG